MCTPRDYDYDIDNLTVYDDDGNPVHNHDGPGDYDLLTHAHDGPRDHNHDLLVGDDYHGYGYAAYPDGRTNGIERTTE